MASFSKRFVSSGLIFWLLLAVVAVYFLHPLRKSLKFGIDLVGGTYVTLRVQTDKAVEAELKDVYREMEAQLKEQGLSSVKSYRIENNELKLNFDNVADADQAFTHLASAFKNHFTDIHGALITVKLNAKEEADLRKNAVSSDIEVLRSRLNAMGVEEIKVAPQGETDIVVELPDVSDFNKAKEIIGKPALLEFRLVEDMSASKDDLLDKYNGDIPSGYEIMPYTINDSKYYVLVEDYAEVSGKHLKDSYANVAQTKSSLAQEPVVFFKLTSQGSKKFAELTGENIGKPLAIILDGKVLSAPKISQAITGGEGYVSGSFTLESAKELASLLKSGAFVAPVTFEEERSVGPALGYESIKSGVISCTVGLILLFIFSVAVYKLAGLFAFIALIYNLLLLLFAMYLLKATVTLPGIAGMVLTIGMAIDSSILIFERVRELLKEGETVRSAIDKGFSGALAVILDANITTFIVGAVLFYFGTGPVKGFAVTLMVGIIATLIAGLFFLKSLFRGILKSGIQKLSI